MPEITTNPNVAPHDLHLAGGRTHFVDDEGPLCEQGVDEHEHEERTRPEPSDDQ